MVLDKQRKNADKALGPIAKLLIRTNVSPNTITWISLLFAAAAGVLFFFSGRTPEKYYYLLYIGVGMVSLNSIFDGLDGKIARLTGKMTKKGDFLDHVIDRYADMLIILGLGVSSWCNAVIALAAVVGVLLTSYLGTQAQAVGCGRHYGGLLGRADRMALLTLVPIIQAALFNYGIVTLWKFTIIEWMLLYFAVVGNITAIQRFFGTLKWFKGQEKEEP
ncbi:MAG: CDP-alcohol phosphatidyltransferase family protein [Thermoplasmata archaeon HGW-Thermoplasmata-1]|nr:MAG: CDP-alcohol phosphatidyltransferase family protein [Thermoplasmata archaeon HGW-Thermoplasmata-1]